MRFAIVAGTTETATIEGISAAGSDPKAMVQTPAADLELVAYGTPVYAPTVPVSPSGCPTPAVITRAVRELTGFELVAVDAGLATRTAAPTVTVGEKPGGDIRSSEPVPEAAEIFERGRELGKKLPDDELFIGESIPGGTTTALAVLTAIGEPQSVSSSLPENPLSLKKEIVAASLSASELSEGAFAGNPLDAIRLAGDPVLAGVVGLAAGAAESGTAVTLAGGTQLLTAATLLRQLGIDESITVATTSFVAADDSVAIREVAERAGVELLVTDPGFDEQNHIALDAYCRGEAKEGVGMGGALALAAREGVSMGALRDRTVQKYEALTEHDGS